MKKLGFCFLAVALAALSAPRAHAAFTFTLNQTGDSQTGFTITSSGTGSFNLSALTAGGGATSVGEIEASTSTLIGGTNSAFTQYTGSTLTGPTNFGPGFNNGTEQPSNNGSTGGHAGIAYDPDFLQAFTLLVPQGYTSGTTISNANTFTGSYASLGINPGIYTYSWGSGANADQLTINIIPLPVPVPEPSTWAFVGLSLVGAGLALRRRTTV